MQELTGAQKKYLRGLANPLKPIILIGKNGLSGEVLESINEALEAHELLKIKYNEFKEEKKNFNVQIAEKCQCHWVGGVGHTALFYRQNEDKSKRQIKLPK